METTKTRQQSVLTFAVKTSPHYTLVSASYGGTTLDGRSLLPSFQTSTEAQTYANTTEEGVAQLTVYTCAHAEQALSKMW